MGGRQQQGQRHCWGDLQQQQQQQGTTACAASMAQGFQ
jgi:hypothetical protein